MTGRFARVPPEVAADDRLTGRALRVFIALCSYANSTGECWPSLATLAQMTGIDRRKIPDLIKELEGRGWLSRLRRKDENGDATSTKYTIRKPEEVAPPKGTGVPVQGDTPSPVQGDTVSPPTGLPGVPAGGALTDYLSKQTNEQPRVKKERGTRFPKDAVLTEEWRQICQERKPHLDPNFVFEKFKRYFTGPDASKPVKRDWARAWMNWIDGERNGTASSNQKTAPGDRFNAALRGATAALGQLGHSESE